MTTEEIIIAIVRILGSLPVLAWPFPGAIIAMLTDFSDLFLMNLLHLGGVHHYQSYDKWLDQVYMLTFLIVALRWQPTPRNIAVALYAYRLAGFAAFEATGERDLLIAFPNLFEFWFVFVAGLKHFHLEAVTGGTVTVGQGPSPDRHFAGLLPFRYDRRQLAIVLPVLLAAKLGQEFTLHVGRFLDEFTAVEAVEWIWRFLTPPF
jgi:hypothetical protein